MRPDHLRHLCAAMLIGAAFHAGCASTSPSDQILSPDAQGRPRPESSLAYHRVLLEVAEGSGPSTVALTFERGQASAPRVVEVFLRPTPNLKLVKSEAGDSLIAAGKQAIFRQTDDGLIRVVAYSASNTETLDTGVLAELQFERTGDGPAQIEIVKDRPLLAPSGANAGLEIGAPLKL